MAATCGCACVCARGCQAAPLELRPALGRACGGLRLCPRLWLMHAAVRASGTHKIQSPTAEMCRHFALGGLLGVLVMAAQVGPARAYACTSDAECQYPGCNDSSCACTNTKITFSSGDVDQQYEVTPAAFGAEWASVTTMTQAMVLASPLNGCSAIGSSVSGKIALIQRGTCNFDLKVLNAQNAGAVAVIVYNNVDGANVVMSGSTSAQHVTIPAAFISLAQGSALNGATESGITVTVPIMSASDADTSHHIIADFSSRGPTDELRIKPDVLCPGVNIHSAHSDGITGSNNCGTVIDSSSGAVATMSGTSMASPLCAGAAALVRDYFFKGYAAAGVLDATKKILPSAALVKAVMIHSAQDVKESAYQTQYPNMKSGYGRVELSSALRFADSGYDAIYKDRQVVANGGLELFCFRVGASAGADAPPARRDFRVTVVWTDPPGDPMSFRSLINDLDLVVHGPDDVQLYGNTLKQTDETHGEYSVRDSNNNAEQVRVTNVAAGVYAVRVLGTDIPSGPQEFALVASASSIEMAPVSECAALQCPNACSGIGQCLASGMCECPLTHGGADCSRAWKVLQPGMNDLSVSWLGMSYYMFELSEGQSFQLSLSPGQLCSGCDADFYMSKDVHPTAEEYDAAIADQYSQGNFRSNGDAKGTWYLGLHAYGGDVNVIADLVIGDGGDADGGAGGGTIEEGTGGGDEYGDVPCAASCRCGRFTEASGQLSDGSGAADYDNDMDCWWIIAPDNADNVTLTFTSFNTEYYFDFVTIYECGDANCDSETWMNEFSGANARRTIPFSVTSNTGVMKITFSSDISYVGGGFEAEWQVNGPQIGDGGDGGADGYGSGSGYGYYGSGYGYGYGSGPGGTDQGECSSPCVCEYFTDTAGSFTDGSGELELYASHANCRWVIDGTVGTGTQAPRITLHFPRFQTESDYDFVTVNECTSLSWTDDDGAPIDLPRCMGARRVARLSGFVDAGINYFSFTGIMEVEFTSDYLFEGLGFEAEWMIGDVEEETPPSHTCTPPCECRELSSPAGMFGDGSREGTYSNHADCTWTIVVPGADWVKIRFVKFDLEPEYDFVRLYECTDGSNCADPNSGTLLASLTGSTLEHGYDGWILASGALRVHFESDISITRNGFTAVWISSHDTVDPVDGVVTWPHPADGAWQQCRLPSEWSRLRADGYNGLLRTGGLGLKMMPGYFHTWVCHYAHSCTRRLGSDVWVPGTGVASATSAFECVQACTLAGFGFEEYLMQDDPFQYYGCCRHLSCMQTCMMRVAGVDRADCDALVNAVHQSSGLAIPTMPCDVEIGGHTYNICGAFNASVGTAEPTLESGLHGCTIGAHPAADLTDPFCWVYNEAEARFEPFGHGSVLGLI